MERRAVIAQDILWSAGRNLVGTYLELGRASAGSRTWSEEGFLACVGPLDHPICNFAADLRLEGASVERLKEVASGRRSFSVYHLPTDSPDPAERLLDAGFEPSHYLAQLVCEPAAGPEGACLESASGVAARRLTASFMAEQFFAKHAGRHRKGILEATVAASPLDLRCVRQNGRITGAVMLFEHAGALGIYNLCVDVSARGRGLGTAMMRGVLNEAASKGAAVTLQCEANLVPWYRRLGFRLAGEIVVYGLSHFKDIDIMSL